MSLATAGCPGKNPQGTKSTCSCKFQDDSISKTLFSVIAIARRNTDESHRESRSDIKEQICSERSRAEDIFEVYGGIRARPMVGASPSFAPFTRFPH